MACALIRPADDGERLVWLEPYVLNKLRAPLRGPGESYSDVILRLVEAEAGTTLARGHGSR